jgi:hypothetical protein
MTGLVEEPNLEVAGHFERGLSKMTSGEFGK